MQRRSIHFGRLNIFEHTENLCIGTDSLLCAAYMKRFSSAHAVELGAGSGVISLLALEGNKFGSIDAVEIQSCSAELCIENAANNGFSEKINVICRDIRELSPSEHIGTSVVFTNPPYMKVNCGKSCRNSAEDAARHELNGTISDFCYTASRLLKTGGIFYIVYRPNRLDTLMNAMYQHKLRPKRMTFVYADEFHSPSSVLIEARKDGGEELFVTPPLLLKQNGKDTEDIKYIYETGNFPKPFMQK